MARTISLPKGTNGSYFKFIFHIISSDISSFFSRAETFASFLALNPLDQHSGLLYSESMDLSEDNTIFIDRYRLVYNFDGKSLQNAIAEIIEDGNRRLQGLFVVTNTESR